MDSGLVVLGVVAVVAVVGVIAISLGRSFRGRVTSREIDIESGEDRRGA